MAVSKIPNVIHIKFDYEEAVRSKKEILSSEMEVLKILKIIKNYHRLRSKELQTKIKLQRKLKQTVTALKRLESSFPEFKVPKILKEKKSQKEETHSEKSVKRKYDSNIESQLKEIQERLKALQ